MPLHPWKTRDLPDAPPLRHLIGPSLILLGLGLGSGEVILWPYLSANWGLGIIWAAVLGLTIQFFLNLEVERYALVRGESVFVGLARLARGLPAWFIATTFIGFGWPGLAASSAGLFSRALGRPELQPALTIGLLLLIGLVLSIGPVLYRTVETYQKVAIGLGVPFIVLITWLVTDKSDWQSLAAGLAGQGAGYRFIPADIPLFTFLGALAYAGAGGNLNLAQSFYVKDKGYGMGAFAQRIRSLAYGRQGQTDITGTTYADTPANRRRFSVWWRRLNWEHALIFWLLGTLTITLLALLAYSTAYGLSGNATGLQFMFNEAAALGQHTAAAIGTLFLVVMGFMLFGTQLTVLDSTSRIITENILIWRQQSRSNVSTVFYSVLWLQILFGAGVILAGFSEPRLLVVLGSVFNALAMGVAFPLIWWLNRRLLPPSARPSLWRQAILLASFIFFSYFSYLALSNALA